MCVAKYSSILSSCGGSRTDREVAEVPPDPESSLELGSPEQSLSEKSMEFVQDVEESILPSLLSKQASSSRDVSEQIEASMRVVGPFLCELLLEHKTILSRVFVGADGRLLISDGKRERCFHAIL